MFNFVILSSRSVIQGEPGFVVKIFSQFLGLILNFFNNILNTVWPSNALGISIILMTIVARVIMLPLAIKSHKSSMKMQELTPEVEKIKKKYKDTKDPEQQKLLNSEIQTLYAKRGINPFSGCLPMLVQMPIFFALMQVMQNIYLYITDIYTLFVDKMAPLAIEINLKTNILYDIIYPKIAAYDQDPNIFIKIYRFLFNPFIRKPVYIDPAAPKDVAKALNSFTQADWSKFFESIPPELNQTAAELQTLLVQKYEFDSFFAFDLTKNPGFFNFPGIVFPILAIVATFLSSYFLMKQQKGKLDGNAEATQKSMMYFMPLFMGYLVAQTPVGVGIYWITSSVFQVVQQLFINKLFEQKKE